MTCPGCGSNAYVERPNRQAVCASCGYGQRYGRKAQPRRKPGRPHTRHVWKSQGTSTINGERRERLGCTYAGCRAVAWREAA